MININNVINEYFNIDKVKSVKEYGSGLINKTYLVEFDDIKYILQKVNKYVFKNPIGVMYNINLVTEYIRKKVIYEGKNYRNATLTLINTLYDKPFAIIDGEYWRCYTCIDGISYDLPFSNEIFFEAGKVVGGFQELLNGFETKLLVDNIPNFHNTTCRYQNFLDTVKINKYNRVKNALKEIAFFTNRQAKMSIIDEAIANKDIPLRVSHNDTKLNNILFDKNNNALCLIDLDTVMKGTLLYDYGDALRGGASLAKEDETDLSKVKIDLNLFRAFTKGFLKSTKNIITNKEIELLYMGYYTMTIELAMRFLTDYLDNDKYFALNDVELSKRPKLNLERSQNQIALVKEIEKNETILKNIIREEQNERD